MAVKAAGVALAKGRWRGSGYVYTAKNSDFFNTWCPYSVSLVSALVRQVHRGKIPV